MNKIKLALAISALMVSNIALADLNTGLVAHWSFDDCTAKDITGNGHDGIIKGNPQCINGLSGKSFSFNGTSDYIEIPNSTLLNPNNLTIVALVNPNKLSNAEHMIINKEAQYELAIAGQNIPQGVFVEKGGISSGDSMFAFDNINNQWQWYKGNAKPLINKYTILGVTLDKSNMTKVYSNGILKRSVVYPVKMMSTNNCIRIGARGCPQSAGSFFNGSIDEIRIYNRALSSNEMKDIYYQIYPPAISGSVSWGTSHLVTCENITQGTTLVLPQTTASVWDCEKAGLTINSGDDVVVSIKGKKY